MDARGPESKETVFKEDDRDIEKHICVSVVDVPVAGIIDRNRRIWQKQMNPCFLQVTTGQFYLYSCFFYVGSKLHIFYSPIGPMSLSHFYFLELEGKCGAIIYFLFLSSGSIAARAQLKTTIKTPD
jgi:hypothetical protein